MKLISWNVNGLRSIRQKGLDSFLAAQNADLVCLQETKIDLDALSKLEPFPCEYRAFASSANRRGYSGVLTLVKPSVSHDEICLKTGIGKTVFDSEGRFVITDHDDFLLYNIYFPSGTSGDERQQFKYRFLDQLLIHLSGLKAKDRNRVILAGDFNICHFPIDIHHPHTAERLGLTGFLPDERQWMDKLVNVGFIDTFRITHPNESGRYSWWSYRAGARKKNLGWRIDYFFVARELKKKVIAADILEPIAGSDHCPITLELDIG